MRVSAPINLCTALVLGLSIVNVAYKSVQSINSEATIQAPQQATPHAAPIPPAGPLAAPKSLKQVGVPVEATRAAPPADNPQTPEKIALGEKLFFDGRLSVDGTVACSTCHDPARAFTDGRPASIGVKGRIGQRNAPTILNALYNKAQFWDGRAKTLEVQATFPIVNPSEMGQPDLDAAVARLAAIPEYEQAFRTVFRRRSMEPTWCAPLHLTNGASFRSIPLSITPSLATRTQSANPLREAASSSIPKLGVTNAMP